MAHEDRHADGRGADPQLGQVEDLAALGDELPLFLGVAVGQEDVDLGQDVERDRVGIDMRLGRSAGDMRADLVLELLDGVGARPRHALVGVDDDPLDADRVAQGHEHRRRAASWSSSGWR